MKTCKNCRQPLKSHESALVPGEGLRDICPEPQALFVGHVLPDGSELLPRHVVVAAGELVRDTQTQEWFLRDERGHWEREARALLNSVRHKEPMGGKPEFWLKAKKEAALLLAHVALTARIMEQRKREEAKRQRR